MKNIFLPQTSPSNMKRVVSSSIITLFIILAITGTYFYIRNFNNSGGDPIKAIPSDASFFLVVDSTDNAVLSIQKFEYLPILRQAPVFEKLYKNIGIIDSLKKSNSGFSEFFQADPLYISAHVSGANNFDFLFIKTMNPKMEELALTAMLNEIAGKDKNIDERNYDGTIIREIQFDEKSTFTFSISKGLFIASFTPFLVEDALRQLKLGKPIITDFKQMRQRFSSTGIDLYVNFNNLPTILNIFLQASGSKNISEIRRFGNWTCLGLNISGHTIQGEGILNELDSLQFVSCFSGQHAIPASLLKIIPENTSAFQYTGLSDKNLYQSKYWRNYASIDEVNRRKKFISSVEENYKLKIDEKMEEWIGNESAIVVLEPTGVNYDNNIFAIFKATKISTARNSLNIISKIIDKKLNSKTKEESYNGHLIGFINLNGMLPALFGDAFSKLNKIYYTDIGDYILFGNQASSVRMFIDEYKSGNFIVEAEHFKPVQKQISEGINYLVWASPASGTYLLKSVFNKEWKNYQDSYQKIFSGFQDFAYMFEANDETYRSRTLINFIKEKKREGVSQAFVMETDSSVFMKALITTNPASNSREIIFQDESETLYLADNSGTVKWTQLIDGKIMGAISEIDLFKNGSRQFLFNTREYLYLLDAEGKPVGNYPIRLPAPATNGISVIDFEKVKEPRIYLACENKRVYAYLPSGKPLPGWNFQQTTGTITDPIRNVKLNGKDYIVINDREGGVSIVNKFGESGIKLIQGFTLAKNSSFFQDPSGFIVTTDISGNVMSISGDGLVQSIPLNAAGPDHGFAYVDVDDDGQQDYVFLDGKELIAYNKALTLIFRKEFETTMSGKLNVFEMNEKQKAFGFVSDVSNKCWLVKTDGSVYPGFPVKGSGEMVIDELNMDGKKNLLIGSSENNFYVYTIE